MSRLWGGGGGGGQRGPPGAPKRSREGRNVAAGVGNTEHVYKIIYSCTNNVPSGEMSSQYLLIERELS